MHTDAREDTLTNMLYKRRLLLLLAGPGLTSLLLMLYVALRPASHDLALTEHALTQRALPTPSDGPGLHQPADEESDDAEIEFTGSKTADDTRWDFTPTHNWAGFKKPVYVFAYSAYYDEREIFRFRRVAIHLLLENRPANDISVKNFTCYFRGGNGDTDFNGREPVEPLKLFVYDGPHAGHAKDVQDVTSDGVQVDTAMLVCPLKPRAQQRTADDNGPVPSLVDFSFNGRHVATVPVRRSRRPHSGARELGVCVGSVYNRPACAMCKPAADVRTNLVPWVEMQLILGASHVAVYNHSMTAAQSAVLRQYARRGVVTVHAAGAVAGDAYRPPGSLAINDCLYRYQQAFRRLVVVDLDEVVVPAPPHTNLPAALAAAAQHHNTSVDGHQFWFANTLFYTDYQAPPPPGTPPALPYLQHTHRTVAQAFPGGAKSVVETASCYFASLHMCRNYAGKLIQVHPSVAKLHHYKPCAADWWRPKRADCEALFSRLLQDDSMLRFSKILNTRVNGVLQELGWN